MVLQKQRIQTSPAEQTAIMLSLVVSCVLNSRRIVKELNNEELSTVVNLGIIRLWEIIREFPVGHGEDSTATRAKNAAVGGLIKEIRPGEMFSLAEIAYIGHRVCGDLLMELCNPAKRALIQEVNMIIGRINDFVDPDGDDEETHANVEAILDQVYGLIGFEISHKYIKHERKLQRRLKRFHGNTKQSSQWSGGS